MIGIRRRGRAWTWLRRNAVAGLILVAGVAVLSGVFWSRGVDHVPGTPRSDFEFYFLTQRVFLGRWISNGVFPLWNPHLFGGYPVVEVSQTALFYPPHLLSLWLVPEALPGLMAELGLHLVLAPLLMAWILARGLRMDSRASAGAALAYAASTGFLYRFFAGHLTVIFTLTWLPVAVLAAAAACAAPPGAPGERIRSGRWWLVAGLAAALVNLAGSPQFFYYCFYAQLAVTVAAGWGQGRRVHRRNLVQFSAVTAAGLLIAAPQWLSTALYIDYASRKAGTYLEGLSLRTLGALLVEFLFPLPLGSQIDEYHLNRRGIWEITSHPGTVAVVLAAVGLLATWRGWLRRPQDGSATTTSDRAVPAAADAEPVLEIQLVAGRTAGALILLGTGFLLGLRPPGASLFREPTRGQILVVLGATVAAGLALDLLARRGAPAACLPPAHRAASRRLLRLGAAACAFFAFGVVCLRLFVCLSPSGGQKMLLWFAELEMVTFIEAAELYRALQSNPAPFLARFRAALDCSLAWTAVVAGLWGVSRHRPRIAVSALAACMAGSVILVSWPPLVPALHVSETRWPPGLEARLERLVGQARARGEQWSVSLPASFFNTSQFLDGLRNDSGYDPLAPLAATSRTHQSAPGEPKERRNERRLLAKGIRYQVAETTATADDFHHPIARRHVRVEEGPATASLVTLSTRFSFLDPAAETTPLFGPLADGSDFLDLRDRAALASRLAAAEPQTTAAEEQLRVRDIRSPVPHELIFQAEAPAGVPVLALIRSTWLPGWRATVDGQSVPVVRANGWMQAVPLPGDGRPHSVRLVYRPPFFTLSLILAGTGCLLYAIASLALLRKWPSSPESESVPPATG